MRPTAPASVRKEFGRRTAALAARTAEAAGAVRSGDPSLAGAEALRTQVAKSMARWQAWERTFGDPGRLWSARLPTFFPLLRYVWLAWLHPRSVLRRATLAGLFVAGIIKRLLWIGLAFGAVILLIRGLGWLADQVRGGWP